MIATEPRAASVGPITMTEEEWQLRLELAALYRLVDYFGWTEMIYNHITLRVPAAEPQFLINPFGLNYAEVTARNLVKINLRGEKLDGSPHPILRAGFVIHSAIHAARPDAHCIIHTHTTAGMAVACKDAGLRHDNNYSAMLHGKVAYHEFEGIVTDATEQPRLVADLGDKPILILRNHGLLLIGQHVPEVFHEYWVLQRACEIQLASDSMAGPNRPVNPTVLAAISAQMDANTPFEREAGLRKGQLFFDAALRRAGLTLEALAG
jgi:ribulose-5-phosphate 4-epimerase/fuculose-1-phosphate aldolase